MKEKPKSNVLSDVKAMPLNEEAAPLMLKSKPKVVQTSLLSDFVKDKRLYQMFRSEIAKCSQGERRERKKAQVISMDMVSDQLNKIIDIHKETMESV